METGVFESELYKQLIAEGVCNNDADFILGLIRSSERDENLKIMENDVYRKLSERGICEKFEKACKKLNYNFTHSNDPEI